MRRSLVMLLAACGAPTVAAAQRADPIARLVARLDLEQYKATIKGLTQFGDRRQGTDRNRAAIDWIEAQLRSYGCNNTERLHYDYAGPPPRPDSAAAAAARRAAAARAAGAGNQASGGGRLRGIRAHTGVNTDS